jgi:group I intron endonuclease
MIVYLVTNKINGKQYVGQTVKKLNLRWNEHTSSKSNGALQRAIRKHNKENFSLLILHECTTKEEMDFVESFYISFLNTRAHNGYNLTNGGEGRSGYHLSEEAKKRISEKNSGHVMSEEQKAQVSKRHKGIKLGPRSEETKRKISIGNMGKKYSEESIRKGALKRTGKKRAPFSEETKRRMSLASYSPAAIQHVLNLRSINLGSKRSEESKAKMREAQKIRFAREKAQKVNAEKKISC